MFSKLNAGLQFLVDKSCFPPVLDVALETYKINVLRIATGLIVFVRTYFIYSTAEFYYEPGLGIQLAFLALILSLLLMAGLFTPIAIIGLLGVYNFMDVLLGTTTLGTNMLTCILIVLLLINAGNRLSVDDYILRNRVPVVSSVLQKIYRLIGFQDGRDINRVYFLAFTSYAIISFGALVYHFRDIYWVKGFTTEVMLANSYLARYYMFFRDFADTFPGISRFLSVSASIGQSAFQILMFPLMFNRIGKYFVICWGLFFFFISIFILQLSYLPYLEIVMWILFFYKPSRKLTTEQTQNSLNFSTQLQATAPKIPNWLIACWMVLMFVFCVEVTLDLSGVNYRWRFGKVYLLVDKALYFAGLDIPIVFNHVDLSMGDRWRVVHRQKIDGSEQVLVPLNDMNGAKLHYQRSDIIYFGNDLQYRRAIIGENVEVFNGAGNYGYDCNEKISLFDYKKTGQSDTMVYLINVYENHSSDIHVPKPKRYSSNIIFTDTLVVYRGEVCTM